MCDPVTVLTSAVGLLASQAMAPNPPKMPDPVAPEKPPQAARVPDEAARRAGRATGAGMGGGPQSTALTGPGGVAPGSLNLGRSTLLGQ